MTYQRFISFSVAFLVLLCTSALPARATGDLGGSGKFVGWWELGGYYGTDESSRGEIVLFTPLAQSATTIFFLDARGKFFEDDVQEANLALGYRKMMPSGWNIGVWGGWDIRDTTNDNTFNQISFGFEALSERYDVRVNGYVPLEDSKGVSDTDTFEALLQGNNIFVQGTNTDIDELAFYGVDAEFGILLFGGNRGGSGGLKSAPAPAKRHELRAYAGGFWFDNDDADDAIAGPKGRLEYRINDVISSLPGSRLTIESELSYDEVRDTKFEIGARIRIPFGARGSDAATRTAALTGQELRMIEGLERDTDIVTNEETETTVTTEGAIDDATDVALNSVSFAQSTSSLKKAIDAGGNRLIILRKGDGRIDVSSTEGQQLQDDQTLQGGASTILIRGKKTGEVVPFTAPGSRPTIFTDDANDNTGAVTLANNTHVAGVNIRGSGGRNAAIIGNNGIVAPFNTSNIVLEQLDIRNMGDDGVRFLEDAAVRDAIIRDSTISNVGETGIEIAGALGPNLHQNILITGLNVENAGEEGINFRGANGVTVTDTVIRNVGQEGIQTGENTQNVLISGLNISDTGQEGIQIGGGPENRNFTIQDTTIRNTADEGIEVREEVQNVALYNVDIRDTGTEGIDIADDLRNITLKHVTITNTGTEGILFGDGNQNVEIAYTTITNTGTGGGVGNGIEFNNGNSNVTLEHVSIRNSGRDGISFLNNNSNVTIRNSTIADPNGFGILFDDNNSNVTLANNTISDTFGDGIFFNGGNSVTITGNTLTNISSEGIDVGDLVANTLTIADNIFAGTIGGNAVEFDGVVDTLLDGSSNQLAPGTVVVGSLCELDGAGGFIGTLEIGAVTFVNGVGCT